MAADFDALSVIAVGRSINTGTVASACAIPVNASGATAKVVRINTAGGVANIAFRAPSETTVTLGTNPFSTTSSSPIVTVTQSSHGYLAGNGVSISGAAAVAGLTLNGVFGVNAIPTTSTFTLVALSSASSTTTGGGSAVTISSFSGATANDVMVNANDASLFYTVGQKAVSVLQVGTTTTVNIAPVEF